MLEKQPLEAFTAPLVVAGQSPTVVVVPHPAAVLSAPAHQLRREAARQAKRQTEPGALGAQHEKARLVSNKTHYSPTDLDARISVKPGKARALNYLWPRLKVWSQSRICPCCWLLPKAKRGMNSVGYHVAK